MPEIGYVYLELNWKMAKSMTDLLAQMNAKVEAGLYLEIRHNTKDAILDGFSKFVGIFGEKVKFIYFLRWQFEMESAFHIGSAASGRQIHNLTSVTSS